MKKLTDSRIKKLQNIICDKDCLDKRIERIRRELAPDGEEFTHFTNHRNVNWPNTHTQYTKFDLYSVR